MTLTPDLDEAASLQSILDSVAEQAPAQTKSAKARKAEIEAAINTSDIDALMALQERMSTVVGKIVGNKIDLDNLGKLTDEELFATMTEYLDVKEVKRLLDVRYAMQRLAIFAHITEVNKEKGVPDPEHTPGEAPVPAMGRKFTREGGKLKARLDHAKLAVALGEEAWNAITNVVEIPEEVIAAHTVQSLDEKKLVKYIQSNPAAMEHIKNAVIPGGYGSSKLMDREIK